MGILPKKLKGKLRKRVLDTNPQFYGEETVSQTVQLSEPFQKDRLFKAEIFTTPNTVGTVTKQLPSGHRWIIYDITYEIKHYGTGSCTWTLSFYNVDGDVCWQRQNNLPAASAGTPYNFGEHLTLPYPILLYSDQRALAKIEIVATTGFAADAATARTVIAYEVVKG